ncbi:uncharacterized protein SCHCODRAFT_02479852, partial [Schizophyllum commune H4-8]|uniref:uncharacterized protein n=1 Tax=Schizophyllum commune (strain H4-8 / FGSC 9210) TaxID=578458 RepID=UPI00215F705F
ENMAHAVWETLGTYGLKGRISAFVMDNATNNDTLVEEIERLCMLDGIRFSATQARLRCMPHTIHLSAIKAGTASSYKLRRLIILQLLEAIGAITRSEADKASSRTVNYQDSVTSPL